jgi:hypothetical protein
MKIPTTDWLATTIVVALFLLPLWLPHVPMFVRVPVAILVLFGGLFFAASALRNRLRSSKHTGQFLGYFSALLLLPSPSLLHSFCWSLASGGSLSRKEVDT